MLTPEQVDRYTGLLAAPWDELGERILRDMVRRILSLQAVPKPDDAADAVAIALCHARSATSLIHQQERFDPCSTI